ncbi:MAG: DUF4139 domain-containing protein [Roseovarius sp.]
MAINLLEECFHARFVPGPLVFALVPLPLWAADIPLKSPVSAVTVYPGGATIERVVEFSAPAGAHDLILLDIPADTDIDSLRVSVTGAQMGTLTTRTDFVPPSDPAQSAAITAAEAEVTSREDALRRALEDIERTRLGSAAAEARIAFLAQIGQGDGMAQMDVAALRDLSAMIGAETLAAREAALAARLEAEAAERATRDLTEALARARAALAALVPQETDRALPAVSITTDAETTGTVTLTYTDPRAYWQPVYDISLARKSGALTLTRGAIVAQSTGENWQDVSVALSTVRPSGQTEPSRIWAQLRRIEDPSDIRPKSASAGLDFSADRQMSAELMEAPIMVEQASASFDGIAVRYDYPTPVSIASGADALRLSLGQLTTQAEVTARAIPLYDQTAFLMANLTNDTGEIILPGRAMLYLDGGFVGETRTDLIAAGDESELSFGPIESLRLTRRVLNREEGDRGVITRSNDLSEQVEIEIRNLSAEAWPLRVLDHVPYSEQEDLEITWQASPPVSEQDVDGMRGVLAWEFDLAPGDAKTLLLEHDMEWPEDKVLR